MFKIFNIIAKKNDTIRKLTKRNDYLCDEANILLQEKITLERKVYQMNKIIDTLTEAKVKYIPDFL